MTDSNAPNVKCSMLIDNELERLEGPRWSVLEPMHPEAKMWKRSYLIALYAVKVLESRIRRLHHWDEPMTFFYPPPDDTT